MSEETTEFLDKITENEMPKILENSKAIKEKMVAVGCSDLFAFYSWLLAMRVSEEKLRKDGKLQLEYLKGRYDTYKLLQQVVEETLLKSCKLNELEKTCLDMWQEKLANATEN